MPTISVDKEALFEALGQKYVSYQYSPILYGRSEMAGEADWPPAIRLTNLITYASNSVQYPPYQTCDLGADDLCS
jgi:hypothetical protein